MTPVRVQRSRKAGSKLPPNTVCVTRGRGMRFGNPFTVKQLRELNVQGSDELLARVCVEAFRRWLTSDLSMDWTGPESERVRGVMLRGLPSLRGKNLACWCPIGSPCHGDVLLELANR